MSHFAIASMQLALPYGNNLEAIGDEIVKTKKRFPWVDMVVLSELASFGPEKKYAEAMPSDTEQFYCALAKAHDLWIIPGSHYETVNENDDDKIYNTTSVINNHGEVIDRYRKVYPFMPYESGIEPGKDFVVFDVPQGRIGVAICYDLWFPEVARAMACLGAEAMVYPTLTGTIDRPLELLMAQSTAVCNQCYVFAINGAGDIGNGKSIAVGPDGSVLFEAGTGQEVNPIEIDFELVRRNRERGIMGLGQPLKSFRDNPVVFPQYQSVNGQLNIKQNFNALDKLGPLEIPAKAKD